MDRWLLHNHYRRTWWRIACLMAVFLAIVWMIATKGGRDATIKRSGISSVERLVPASRPGTDEFVFAPVVGAEVNGDKALEADKMAFFENLGLAEEKLKSGEKSGTPRNPVFMFYVGRLASDDAVRREHAFKIFVNADPNHPWADSAGLSESEQKDVGLLSVVLSGLKQFALAPAGGVMFEYGVERLCYPELYDLVDALIPRLSNPDEQEAALNVINAVTVGVYEDKEMEWWAANFAQSKLAGIFQRLPREDWISRPE